MFIVYYEMHVTMQKGKEMLNGIDISSHQAGIDLTRVPADFVIVKATEGTTYINPYCDLHFQQAAGAKKKLGVYHFASGGNSVLEADYFVNNVEGYIGKALLVLDWEADAVNRGPGWAKAWLDRVQERTGVKPLIYMSNSVVNSYDWSAAAAADYGLWNAGYYAGNQIMGYNPQAPLVGGTGAWPQAAIYQYTSSGRLAGWGDNLDLNVFYGDETAWDHYTGKIAAEVKPPIQIPGEPSYKEERIAYRAHCQTVGWLEMVRDGQAAGTSGFAKRLEALRLDIKMKGVKIKAKAHIQTKGTVGYGYITPDTVIGTTGEALRLEGLELIAEGLPEGMDIWIRYHVQKEGWSQWVKGGFAGTFGIAKRMEAIQIKIE